MQRPLIVVITAVALLLPTAASHALEKDIEVDILVTRITGLMKEGKNVEALTLFEKLEGMNVKVPESFDFYYIDTLDKAGKASKALERSEIYLKKYGKKGKYYGQVIEIVGRRSAEVEKERKAADAKSKADQAAAEAKARADQAKQFRDEARRYAEIGDTEKVVSLLAGAAGILVDTGDDAIKQLAEQMKELYVTDGVHYLKRYRDNRDGTVTDVTTNKIWKRCLEGQAWSQQEYRCNGKPSSDTWPSVEKVSKPWYVPDKAVFVQELMYCAKNLNAQPDQDGKCPGEQRANMNRIAFRFMSEDLGTDLSYIFTISELPERGHEYDCASRKPIRREEAWAISIRGRFMGNVTPWKVEKRSVSCRTVSGEYAGFDAVRGALLLYRFAK